MFISKSRFREKGYLGSGGIGRFRDTLWAAIRGGELRGLTADEIALKAEKNKKYIYDQLTTLKA